MKKAFACQSFSLLCCWEFESIDEDTGKKEVVPASPTMINAAIIEFVDELDQIISGKLNFDGENVSRNDAVVEHLNELRRHLLDFQAAWKRMFLQNHVHIFLAFFRVFGNGDMTVVPKTSRKASKLFTNYFSWDTMGLWYLVIRFVISIFLLYFYSFTFISFTSWYGSLQDLPPTDAFLGSV
jgi:hypothetical protein